MSNQPDINKRVLSVRVSREFYRRLQKGAKQKQMGFNEYVRWLIYNATDHIPLNKADYAIIEVERNEDAKRTRAKRRLSEG
jgi:hypothetical protein